MRTKKTSEKSVNKALLVRSILDDHKAENIVILDLRGLTLMCDFFVICNGTSPTHIRGLVDSLREELAKKRIRCYRTEGEEDAGWALVDCGDVIIHVFSEELREYYSLERLWADAPQLNE